MCRGENYIRFNHLAKNFEENSVEHNRYFETKLGPRMVECFKSPRNENIVFIYYDKDNSPLFYLNITKEGRIVKKLTMIDDNAIFSAVYEIECLLYNIGKEHKDSILESLFETTYDKMYSHGFFNYGFTNYR